MHSCGERRVLKFIRKMCCDTGLPPTTKLNSFPFSAFGNKAEMKNICYDFVSSRTKSVIISYFGVCTAKAYIDVYKEKCYKRLYLSSQLVCHNFIKPPQNIGLHSILAHAKISHFITIIVVCRGVGRHI